MRTKRVMAAVSVALVLSSCAHVRPVAPTAAVAELDEINQSLAGREARVRLTDGTEMFAHDVVVSQESVSLRRDRFPDAVTPWPERETREIPLAEIASIEVKCRGRGALDGLLIGLLGGTLGGAVFGAATFSEPDLLISSRGDAALIGSALFGVLGTGVGALLGTGIGSTHVYEFQGARVDTGAGRIWN